MAELVRVIALDGPAGTGKSSVARGVAEVLKWRFVDTGATYRAVTLAVLRAGVSLDDPSAVAEVAQQARVELDTDPRHPTVRLDGEDVSAQIRGDEVTTSVSRVSAVPAVRACMVTLQRRAMGTNGAVVEGRDIATVVAPYAGVKVYLDARPEVRAQRRATDLQAAQGQPLESVAAALRGRDSIDNQTNRLDASEGAVRLDTSDLTLDEVVARVVQLAERAGLRTP